MVYLCKITSSISTQDAESKFSKSEYVIDISYKDDLYEYLAAVDVAVTDYSSVAFDAAYMKIPVFLYVDDYKEYVEDRGDLLWRYEEIPFPLPQTIKS